MVTRSSSEQQTPRHSDGHDHEHDNLTLVELFKELRDESSHLLREEVALAKAEMSEKAGKYARNTGYMVAGAALATTAFMFLALAGMVGIYLGLVAAGLTHATSGWLAPLITAAIFGLIGYGMIQKGVHTLKHESPVPEKTVHSLKQDKNWVKEKVKS